MVQRKVATKLGLQSDHVKSENLLQHQEMKNRGAADLKKKMKKSGSIKRSDLDSLRSPNLRRHVKQPGEPPPLPPLAATPQKQSSVSPMATTPNYMKSTSSFDARKEQLQVSAKSPQARPDISSLSKKSSDNPELTIASGNKANKTLARTSSSKMMRTLTKNPSFKPARVAVRKCSPVVLCENLDAQRATCSSTLKDCKFPAYLTLDPGGTESEGTSAIKVCPYTYCSLNGHHHAPLPPLKCFLSARRRMLKTQRSKKLGCLSPRRVKPTGDNPNFDEKLRIQVDVKSSATSSMSDEEHTDFFIEVFSKKKEDTADYTGIDGSASDSSVVDLLPSDDRGDETAAENQEDQVLETLSDTPICSDIDTCETFDQNRDNNSIDTGNQEAKVDEEVSPPVLAQEERKLAFLSESPADRTRIAQLYEVDSEDSDIDWETGHHSALYLDYDYLYSPKTEREPDPEAGKVESHVIHDNFTIKSEDKGDSFDDFFADEVSQESYEESLNSDAFSSSNDSESTDSYDHLQSLNNMETPAPVDIPVEEPEPADDDKNQILFECNQTPGTGLPFGNQNTGYCIIVEEETSCDNLICKSPANEDALAEMGDQVSNLLNNPLDEIVTSFGKSMCDTMTTTVVSDQTSSEKGCQVQTQLPYADQTSNTKSQENSTEKTLSPVDPAKEHHSEIARLKSSKADRHIVNNVKAENAAEPETEESALVRATAKCKKPIQESDDLGLFNPRAPNFLPVEPDPEAEKVDLRHQELDERKNTEEWMVDYALRQAVTKLAPARKRKVALLVEAFEKVMPITTCELHTRHSSAFDHARPIQACN